jgi:hypothetical protein
MELTSRHCQYTLSLLTNSQRMTAARISRRRVEARLVGLAGADGLSEFVVDFKDDALGAYCGAPQAPARLDAARDHVLAGLAAALKRKPTVARYALYFRHLQVACFDNESGPYGGTRCYYVAVMSDHFPENKGSMEENMVRKPLKRRKLLSVSFPKRLLLGQVVPYVAAQSLP